MTHPALVQLSSIVSQYSPFSATGIQEGFFVVVCFFFFMKSRSVGQVAEAIGFCLTTCISKDSKQKGSERQGTEARTAQFSSVLSGIWI